MINKLHKFKQTQINLALVAKKQLETKVIEYTNKIDEIDYQFRTAKLSTFGSISDFRILAIHKNFLTFEKEKLEKEKEKLEKKLNLHIIKMQELYQELEQYNYILEENKLKHTKHLNQLEAQNIEEFVQAKWSNHET